MGNTISEMFVGKKIQLIKTVNPNGDVLILNEKEEKMGPIYIDISLNRLYEAWDEYALQEVEDFNNQPNQKCLSESWISQPPNTLFFALNRVQYNKQTNRLEKSNNFFQFDKVIYADMFLSENREKTMQVRQQVQKWKHQIKVLKETIKTYQKFNGGCSLSDTLNNCSQFILSNKEVPQ